MSGVVNFVKDKVFKPVRKVFSKVWKAVKKIAKPLLMIAAVYFTAGIAMGAFGGAGFVSTLPGWGTGGIFSSMAGGLGGWTGFASGGALTAGGSAAAGGFTGAAVHAGAAESAAAAIAPGALGPVAETAATAAPAAAPAASSMIPQVSTAAPSAAAPSTAAPGGFTGAGVHATAADSAAAAVSPGALGPEPAGLVNGAKSIAGDVWSGVKAAGTAMNKYPALTLVASQGFSKAYEAREERKLAEEEEERRKEIGFWGMDQKGNQYDYTTKYDPNEPRPEMPTWQSGKPLPFATVGYGESLINGIRNPSGVSEGVPDVPQVPQTTVPENELPNQQIKYPRA